MGEGGRWATSSRWSRLRMAMRVALGLLGLLWTMVTVAWLKLGHPMDAAMTAAIVVVDLLWVVRTGHPAGTAEADDAWSRQALPVGIAVLVLSLVALSPSRSASPSAAIVGLSFVMWACVGLAVWLTGTSAEASSRSGHPARRRPS